MEINSRNLLAGAAGGLLGGVVFGVMMTALGMMEMVAGLVESESAAVGWLVHLVISLGLGVAYALALGAATHSYGRGAGLGALYGVVIWILGPLLVMPLWLGMPPFVIEQTQMMSLMGHLVYGVLTGLTYQALSAHDVAAKERVHV